MKHQESFATIKERFVSRLSANSPWVKEIEFIPTMWGQVKLNGQAIPKALFWKKEYFKEDEEIKAWLVEMNINENEADELGQNVFNFLTSASVLEISEREAFKIEKPQ